MDLKWEKKKRLGLTEILDQINDATKQIVFREVSDLTSKIETLKDMGLIKDCEQMEQLKCEVKKLNLNKED